VSFIDGDEVGKVYLVTFLILPNYRLAALIRKRNVESNLPPSLRAGVHSRPSRRRMGKVTREESIDL